MPETYSIDLDEKTYCIEYDKVPNYCPLCHKHIMPKEKVAAYVGDTKDFIQIVFQCANIQCLKFFIGEYHHEGYDFYALYDTKPKNPNTIKFSSTIESLSTNFVDIYNQAIAAESFELSQLTGIGLRKALEFLIKDFLIKQKPEQGEEIKKIMLGPCIKKYIDDPKVKACAERATWLGNDETHYVRKWEDKDISDLKKLINLTVHWIEYTLETEKCLEEMPTGK